MSLPQDVQATNVTANTAITTTSEIIVVTSPPVGVGLSGATFLIAGFAQLTTGTNTTAVTARIRRGTLVGGTLVGEGNAITIGAAAGSTEQYIVMVSEFLQNIDKQQYVMTLQQAGASADGSCLQASMLVIAI